MKTKFEKNILIIENDSLFEIENDINLFVVLCSITIA